MRRYCPVCLWNRHFVEVSRTKTHITYACEVCGYTVTVEIRR